MLKERHTYTYGPVVELAQENSECVYCGREVLRGEQVGIVTYYIGGSAYLKHACTACLQERGGPRGNISGHQLE